MREALLFTNRTMFSRWKADDLPLAESLWGDPDVAHFICARGCFTKREIEERLQTEMENDRMYGVQYWPVFCKTDGAFLGCCGLRPYGKAGAVFELGVHLRPQYWRKGLAVEMAGAVICHAFTNLGARKLYAGHHPENTASRALLRRLGFCYVEDTFYSPTGLYHPTYCLDADKNVKSCIQAGVTVQRGKKG